MPNLRGSSNVFSEDKEKKKKKILLENEKQGISKELEQENLKKNAEVESKGRSKAEGKFRNKAEDMKQEASDTAERDYKNRTKDWTKTIEGKMEWGNAALGGLEGAGAGAAAGAAIGSVIPAVGNLIGGVVGSVIGFFTGGAAKGYTSSYEVEDTYRKEREADRVNTQLIKENKITSDVYTKGKDFDLATGMMGLLATYTEQNGQNQNEQNNLQSADIEIEQELEQLSNPAFFGNVKKRKPGWRVNN